MIDLESVEGGPMLREERAFLRALAAYFPRETTGREREITWEELARTARALLASVGALSVPGEAAPKADPPSLCQCGHLESVHDHGRSCFADCGCRAFRRDLQPEGSAPPPEKEREGIPKRLTHPERRFFEAAQEGWAALRTVLHFGEDKPGLAAENIDNAWLLLDRAPPEKEPRPMWKLEMTCCGREEPPSYHATWEEADATREAWLSNAEHGRGHSDRSATIVRAAPPKEPPAPPWAATVDVSAPAETRSVEEILAELLLMWGDSCRTLAMLRNIQRLYRAEKEASARTLAEYRRGLALCNDFSVTLRAERDAALLDSKESMTLYRQNRARLRAERDDLAKFIEMWEFRYKSERDDLAKRIEEATGAMYDAYRKLETVERDPNG